MQAVILDRDGVINVDSEHYIKTPDEWTPIPNSLKAIALMNQKGYKIFVATNQSGLARGLYNEATLGAIHKKMTELIQAQGGHIEDIVYCPHGPNQGCECRKPQPGLLHQLQNRYELTLNTTPFVGDSFRDIEAGISAGCPPILVKTGNGRKTLAHHAKELTDVKVFEDLFHFAEHLKRLIKV